MWLFVDNYTKQKKFVLLKRFILKIDIFGLDIQIGKDRHCFQFSFQNDKSGFAELEQSILQQIKTFNMQQVTFKNQKVHPWRELNPGSHVSKSGSLK